MISLPLAKLSTAQDAFQDEQTFQWKHETHNLICVIDSYQAGGSALQLLKVVQGTQIRQEIELERLINRSQDLMYDMQKRGVELKGDQLPISAIIRCPLIAIRWQLPDQKIRRLQMRFGSNEDFDLVYKSLHCLGLRMTPPQSQSKDRNTAANAEQSSAVTQTSSSTSRLGAKPAGPSCPPSRLSEISSRPYTAVSTPAASEPHSQDTRHARPSSAFTGYGFTSSNPLTPPMYFPRPDSASVVSSEYSPSFPPRDLPITTIENHDTTTTRPETALLYERPDTAELPPRRELPFTRNSLPTSSGSDHNRPHSRPSTGYMGPPPLPSRVNDLRPGSARSAGLDSELPPLRQPTILPDTTKQPSSPQRPRTPRPASRGPSKSGQGTTIHEDQNLSTASKSPQAYPSPATTSPSAPRPFSPVSDSAQNQRSIAPPFTFANHSTRVSKDQTDRALNSFVASNTENALEAYAMQSDDARRAALDGFILKNLDDKNFLTLVEDVEANWARIGLGMW